MMSLSTSSKLSLGSVAARGCLDACDAEAFQDDAETKVTLFLRILQGEGEAIRNPSFFWTLNVEPKHMLLGFPSVLDC